MAQRVQVQDLADAPKLQATIQSGGQYSVAVQRAGSNKMLDLADALSKINPTLREYTAIGDIDAQQYEDRLAGMSPEDLQKELKKTSDKWDNLSRKGGLFDWAMSPINEKRKRRALGKAAYGQFELAATARLNTPLEGDRDLTTATIVEDEFSKFVEANPALQGQYAGEGFREAVNPLINNLSRQYDTNKAKEAQKEVGIEAVNSMIRTALDASKDAFDLDMRSVVDDMTDANGVVQESAWNSLNAMSPAVQRATITSVTKSLAKEDPILARRFLNWSKTELKVGNALYGTNEAHVIELEDVIDDTEEQNEKEFEEEREDFVNDQAGGLKIDLTRLNAAKKKDKNSTITVTNAQGEDVEIGSTAELEDIYKDKVLNLRNISAGDRGRILTSFDSILKDDLNNGEDIAIGRIRTFQTSSQPSALYRRFNDDAQRFLLTAQVSEATKKHPAIIQAANEAARLLNESVVAKTSELLEQSPNVAGSMLDAFAAEEYQKGLMKYEDTIVRLAERLESGAETADAGGLFTGVELPKPGEDYPTPDSFYFTDSGRLEDIYEKSAVWYAGAAKGDKTAIGLIQQYMPELEEAYGKAAAGGSDEDKQRYFQVARFMEGIFTLDVLENVDENGKAQLERGIRFDPKITIGQQNAGIFVLMTKEQLDTKDDPKTVGEVDRIIKAIGFKGDRLSFVRAQEALHKKIGSTLVEYEEPKQPRTKPVKPQVGMEQAVQEVKERKQKEDRNSKIHDDVTKAVKEEASKLNLDPNVFNFDMETIGDTNQFGTLVSNSGVPVKFGGILERTPELYAGYMNYKQFRGLGKNKVLMYSQPITVKEFIEKINQPDAKEELDLTEEQVADYKKLINATL